MRPISLVPEAIKAPLRRRLHEARWTRSQAGQDVWVFGEVFNGMTNGYFVDVGAYDGREISNTFILERRFQWRGICIEASPTTFAQLRAARHAICINACVDRERRVVSFVENEMLGGILSLDTDNRHSTDGSRVRLVDTIPLADILDENEAPKVIDYLSVDVEGAEDRVLLDFPFETYSFNCMTIERPSDLLQQRVREAGYILVRNIPGLDAFYISESFIDIYRKNLFDFYTEKRLCVSLG